MGTGSVVCPACGGAAPRGPSTCPYCGAAIPAELPVGANDAVERRTYCTRCGELYPARAGRCPRCPPADTDEKGGRCPRCGQDLQPETMGKSTVDRCTSCRGLWFDGGEIEQATDVTTKGLSISEASATRPALPAWNHSVEEVRYLACVRCGQRMARRQVAPRAGIIIDICRSHGVWFDAGEFEHFKKFAEAGGLEVARLDGARAAEMKRKDANATCGEYRPPPLPWRHGPHSEYSLVYGLIRLVEKIFTGR